MTQRLLFPAFTYAWLATLASSPLILAAMWIVVAQPVLEDVAGYGGLVLLAYEYAIPAWGISITLAGLLTWPLTRLLVQRLGANVLALAAYGLALGATCAMIASAIRDTIVGGFDVGVFFAELGETAGIGGAVGAVWAAWFSAFSNWIGVYRKRPDGHDEGGPR